MALATPPGVSAVAVVRCSGPAARSTVEPLLASLSGRSVSLRSHRVHLAHLVDPATGRPIDEVLVLFMERPRSFTREDVVEIHCHGSPVQARRVIRVLTRGGMRLAEPGEFTRRAFLNGRIGLADAEAIDDLVHAATETAADVALDQLHGSVRSRVSGLRAALLDLISLIEANLDFPEDDIEIVSSDEVLRQADAIHIALDALAATYERGRVLRAGVRTLIAGRPNAGKSSLLNVLLKTERAIVSHTPGTTRDTIEEPFVHQGVLYSLVDSAGIRATCEEVEAAGVSRTLDLMRTADLVVYLVDGSRPVDDADLELLAGSDPKRFQLVISKADLPCAMGRDLEGVCAALSPVRVSATTGEGVDRLLAGLNRRATDGLEVRDRDPVIVSERHVQCLASAGRAVAHFRQAVRDTTPLDVATVDLYEATHALGSIIGAVVTEDILDRIFERFCIGK